MNSREFIVLGAPVRKGYTMFKALGRYFRALGYLVTGRIDQARASLDQAPEVIQATYDRIVSEKTANIQRYTEAVGAMIAQEESKKNALKGLTAEIQKLEKLKAGAAARAKGIVDRYNGDVVAVRNDPEYAKAQAAFRDFSESLNEKAGRVNQLEEDIEGLSKNITGHKTSLQNLLRDLEKLKEEKHETVADMMSAKEEKAIADMLSGISEDRTSEELVRLRKLRNDAKGSAKASKDLAGLGAKPSESEFLQYASDAAAMDDFDKLIGLGSQQQAKAPTSEAGNTTPLIPEG